MKRRDLIRHLLNHGCEHDHEGGSHTVWKNPTNGNKTAVPRHRELSEELVKVICKEVGIPKPRR